MPPEVKEELDNLVKMVDPYLKHITEMLHKKGIPIEGIEFGFGKMPGLEKDEATPPSDLVNGIKKILDANYQNNVSEICGVMFDRNLMISREVGQLLVAARKRDKISLANELQQLINRLIT